MDINTICFEKDVLILSTPKGRELSQNAKLTQDQIKTLTEIEWALSSLQQLLKSDPEVKGILGKKGTPGGLTIRGWEIWQETTKELIEQTGVQQISIVLLAQKAAEKIKAQKYPGSLADTALLEKVSQKAEGIYEPIRQTLKGTAYPRSAQIYQNIPTENRSLGAVIISILGKLNEKLPPQLKSEIGISKIIIGEPSLEDVAAVAKTVKEQIQNSCRAYADLISKQPIAPAKPKPKSKPTPPPKPAKPAPSTYGINGKLMPLAYVHFWDGDSEENRGSVRGSVSGYVSPSDKMRLQVDYRGFVDAAIDSEDDLVSRQSQDFAAFSLEYSSRVVQLAYAWERIGKNEEHLWALGPGYKIKLPGGHQLFPFIGGIAGSSFENGGFTGGGYVGGRYSYMFKDLKIEVSAQALYNLLYRTQIEKISHRLDGSTAVVWNPVSFLRLGIAAGVDGKLNVNGSTDLYVGPVIGFSLPEFNVKEFSSAPLPVFGGRF